MKPVLLCLHGWGGSKDSFTELREALKGTDIEILTPDLPGFGSEPEPKEPWDNDDYAKWVTAYVRDQGIAQPILLLGHSHGGRIAIKLAASHAFPIKHLFLCAPAGIRQHEHFKRAVGYALAKAGKSVMAIPGLQKFQTLGRTVLYKLLGVHDYERASPVMQATLQRVREETLQPFLSRINVPTDIFWGTEDRMTPVSDAHVAHKEIAHSTLHIFPGIRHRVHRDTAVDISTAIRKTVSQ